METLDALKKELQDARARLDKSDAFTQALLNGMPCHVKLRYYTDNDEKYDTTSLHLMCEHGVAKDDGLLEHLHRVEWETNQRDSLGRTPLMIACMNGHTDCVKTLFLSDATHRGLNFKDNSRLGTCRSALHYAIGSGEDDCVQILLDHGADITGGEQRKYTALHIACEEYQPTLVKMLLGHNADLEATDKEGTTALHVSCLWGSAECLRVLLEAGANANATDVWSKTGLHYASYTPHATSDKCKNLACTRLLLDAGTKVDAPDSRDRTPLRLAFRNGYHTLVRTLLEAGADPNFPEEHDVVKPGHCRCKSLLRRAIHLGKASQVVGGLNWTPGTHRLLDESDQDFIHAAQRALILLGKRYSLPRDVIVQVFTVVATCV